MGIHEVPVCDIKVETRHATDVNRIPGAISFLIPSHREFTQFIIIIIYLFIYLLQLGCYPVAVVILHVNKT